MSILRSRSAVLVATLALVAAACGATGADGDQRELVVFAAASLTDAFTELGEELEARNPGTEVTFSFAASSALARQLAEGAPADVFAAADSVTMRTAIEAGAVSEPAEVFATNVLEIVVAPGNPNGVASLRDLADPDLVVVLAAPEVPAGRYSAEVLERAGVEVTPRSLEESPRAVLAKVAAGEADAGIVYATDVASAGDRAEGIPIPDDQNVVATYPVALTTRADDPELAQELVDLLFGPVGRQILARHGFGAP